MMTAQNVIDWLKLQRNEIEGGYYQSTYTSQLILGNACLSKFPPTNEGRPISSGIYYLLDSRECSVMHRVNGEMTYHFYAGASVQMLLLLPDGLGNRSEVFTLGNDVSSGALPQKFIPGGAWLGSRLKPGGEFALMGVTMAPGFHPEDYEIANRNDLVTLYPEQKELITILTRE